MVLNRGSGLGSSSGLASRSVLIAVSTNTRSPHTTGEALPRPGSRAFHLMLVVASHFVGGSAVGADPFASGPRQWCQFADFAASKSSDRAAVVSEAARTRAAKVRDMVFS